MRDLWILLPLALLPACGGGRSNPPGLTARGGSLEADGASVPAVVVVALASAAVNPFASRESVRFDHFATRLEFENGVMSTDTLSLDGPDIRAFASGGVDVDPLVLVLVAEVILREAEGISLLFWHRKAHVLDNHFRNWALRLNLQPPGAIDCETHHGGTTRVEPLLATWIAHVQAVAPGAVQGRRRRVYAAGAATDH